MVSTNRFEGKDRRRERRRMASLRSRNHIAKDLKTDKYHQRIVPDGRKRKYINTEDEYFFEEVYYDGD